MTNILRGKEFTLTQETDIGLSESVIKDIDNWTVKTSQPFKTIIEDEVIRGTKTKTINLWEKYLDESTGFFVEEHRVGFTAITSKRKSGIYRYWQARKRVNGKLHTVHAGTSKKLNSVKIEQVCKKLLAKIEVS